MNGPQLTSLLLIEDNVGDARLVREMLLDEMPDTTTVTHVQTMADAEAFLAEEHTDIVVLDLGLRDAEGLVAIRRAHAAAPGVPLVVLTGTDDLSLAAQALQAGAQDYLIKGEIEARALSRALRYAMERNILETSLQRISTEQLRSNRELEDFAGIASHDLQEPLRKIRAFGERLAEHSGHLLDAESTDYLERIRSAATRMQALVLDLLEFASITGTTRQVQLVDLGSLIAGVLLDVDERVRATDAHIEVGPMPTVLIDPRRISQVLQNLLANALKFHRVGESPLIRVSARPNPADARSRHRRAEPALWEITVEDEGIGFDEASTERLFQPFERLHQREAYGGTGMGLAICRRIIEGHGGTITAYSPGATGSRFVFTLPAPPAVLVPVPA